MKKFVRYLYAYKNGKCVQNVGFVKCEESEDRAVLQIYGKGFPVNGDDMFELFLFYIAPCDIDGVNNDHDVCVIVGYNIIIIAVFHHLGYILAVVIVNDYILKGSISILELFVYLRCIGD